MVKKFSSHLLVIMCMFYSFVGYAHDADKAYFKIQKEAGNIVVFAEFPWSIRKVLDNIKVENVTDQDLKGKLFSYINEHLILEEENGKRLPIVSVELFKKKIEDHHSTANYKIFFKGNQLYKVINTLMCDYYKDQLNYHVLFNQSDFIITSAKNSSFIVQESSLKSGVIYCVVGLFLMILVVVFYRITKKKTV